MQKHAKQVRKCPGGGVIPYMGYIGMCGPKGYGFSAVLVINRVSIMVSWKTRNVGIRNRSRNSRNTRNPRNDHKNKNK